MANNTATIFRDRRGRMQLKVIRKTAQYDPYYSAIVFRSYKKSEDVNGKPQFEDTHWMDEQDILHSKKLHDIADDIIAGAKRKDKAEKHQEVG